MSAQNVRYAKDARLAVRNGYRSGGAMATNQFAGAAYSDRTDVYMVRQAAGSQANARIQSTLGPSASATAGSGTTHEAVPSGVLTPPQKLVEEQLALGQREIASIASLYSPATDVAYLAFTVINSVAKTATNIDPTTGQYIEVVKYNPYTGAIIDRAFVTSAVGTPHTNVKMVICNTFLCVYYAASGDNIRMTSFIDAAGPGTLVISGSNNVVSVTAFAGKAPYFDISPGASATESYLVYQSAATTLNFGTLTSTGVFASLNTLAGTSSELRASISPTGLNPTDQVAIVWLDGATFITGNAKYAVYKRSTVSFIVPAATYYSAGDCTGYPVVAGCNSTYDWAVAFNTAGTGGNLRGTVCFTGSALTYAAKQNTLYGHYVASKPFALSSGLPVVVTTDVDSTSLISGSYYLLNCYQSTAGTGEPQVVAEWGQLGAQQSDVAVTLRDPRQTVSVAVPTTSQISTSLGAVFALAVATTKSAGWKVYRSEYGALEDLLPSCKLNSDLHFAGSRILTFDGSVVTESGFSLPPAPVCTPGGGGSLAAGTYQVLVVWEWFDAKGRRHKSAPSLPTTVTVGAAGTIAVTAERPYATNKNVSFSAGNMVTLRVYRTTLTQPTIFLDGFGIKQGWGLPSQGYAGTLTLADASIATNEALYTQGIQGGLSGLLQNDRPPGAKYIGAGADRLIIGGMENPSEVWFSKLRTEGEPMQWTNFAAYKAQVDGVVTAVAEMDGTWFVATYNNWWRISGAGPQDSGANGSFDSPSRLPNNIGCISHKSCLLVGTGLIFQGAPDRLYILPRGGGDPQDIGLQVRDTLAAFPYITASAFDQQSNVAYWACCNTAGTAGRILIYDVRLGEWYVDSFINRVVRTLAVNNSLLRIDGQAIETVGSWQDTDGTTPTTVLPVLTMGDLRPFGMNGHGSLRRVVLQGEARDVVTAFSPTLDVSYDSGKTFTTESTWAIANLATAIGDSIEADHMLQYPRGDTYRFRLSWTTPSATEGIVFNGLSLELYPEAGVNRLGPSKRA